MYHVSDTMSKDKTRTRGASANNAAGTDKPTTPTEFTEYVRYAFEKMNVKMDSIITRQEGLERKFETVTAQVTKNMNDIGEIQHAIDYHCDRITDTVRAMKDAAVKVTQHEGEINILNRIHTLEEEVNGNERLSRSFNARFLGVAETRGDNCLAIVEDILRLKF